MSPSTHLQDYIHPFFKDQARSSKLKKLKPLIEQSYKEFSIKQNLPGYAFGIMLDGELIHSGANGFIDLSQKTPASTHSMFRIASMTKSFTAMAILILRDSGKLKLDDRVTDYIPELEGQSLTPDSPALTIRDLLIHSAGFPTDDPWADRKLACTEEELQDFLKEQIFFSNVAGIEFEYSNLGYALLGMIIKKVSGRPYGQFILENICQPLNMQIAWEFRNVPHPQLAKGYKWSEGNWTEEELLGDGIFGAMGGMITSIESFAKYAAFHQYAWPARNGLETTLLRRSSIREMHQPWRFNQWISDFKYPNGKECSMVSAYGFGLRWLCDAEKRIFVGHSGGLPGFGSNWSILPSYGLGAILFTNLTYAPAEKANLELLDRLIKEAELKPIKLPVSSVLEDKKNSLIELLPHWQRAENSGLFAQNFFLDRPFESLKKESEEIFKRMGNIIQISEITPQNQLSGYFFIEGEKFHLKVNIALTPENPPLIQSLQIKEFAKPIC